MPTSATSSRTAISYLLESTFGTTPGSGTPSSARITGESLAFQVQTETNKEIRSDRNITDVIPVGASASGGLNFNLSYKEFDTLFEAALMGTWSTFGTAGVGSAAAVTINSTAGTLTWGSAPTGNDSLTNLAVGQWFKFTAPSDAATGAYLKVASRTSTTITVDATTPIPGSGTRSAVAGCYVTSSRLANGVTSRSFSIQKAFTDVNQFFMYRGMMASKLSMSLASGAIANGSFDFMGKDSVRSGSTLMPGAAAASQTYDVMNAVNGVTSIFEGGAASTHEIKSLKFDVDNKLRGKTAIGTLGNVGVLAGTLEVKGEMEIYLADGTLYDKFINNTASSISWLMKDGSGNGYVVSFPKLKYTDAKVTAGSIDQDVMLSIPFQGLYDPTSGNTITLDRV